MHLNNRFKNIDKHSVWEYHKYCALCASNNMCSLHHILGTVSDSILNSCMLCHNCHSRADGKNVSDTKFQSQLLQYTMRQIMRENYKLSEKDIEFYKTNEKLYNYINEGSRNTANNL